VKGTRQAHRLACHEGTQEEGSRYRCTLSLTSDLAMAWRLYPRERKELPNVQEAEGEGADLSGRLRKISLPPRSKPRTVQPVRSRYIAYLQITQRVKMRSSNEYG